MLFFILMGIIYNNYRSTSYVSYYIFINGYDNKFYLTLKIVDIEWIFSAFGVVGTILFTKHFSHNLIAVFFVNI